MLKFTLVLVLTSFVYCHENLEYEIEEPELLLDNDCIQKTYATEEDVYALKNFQLPTTKAGQCLLACMYKKISIMTPEGKFSIEEGLEPIKNAIKSHPRISENLLHVINQCAIEASDIEDDYEGCELATTLFTCIVNNINEFWQSDESESNES